MGDKEGPYPYGRSLRQGRYRKLKWHFILASSSLLMVLTVREMVRKDPGRISRGNREAGQGESQLRSFLD
jgi:hypothetical protein